MMTFTKLLGWAQHNERHLGAVVFVFGFVTDLFTFAYLPANLVNFAFLGYLAVAALCTAGSHLFAEARNHPTVWRRTLSVVFPLGAQYAIGGLLSGCLIFYAKSAAVLVSWPFILLLALVFIGNEYFRTYYKHLAFQVVLFFFAIYAYAIFALPVFVRKLGPWIFLSSTVLSIALFAGFLYLLSRFRRPGFLSSLRYIIPGSLLVVVVMNVSYFTGLVPPIPLSLPDAGIYHSVSREEGRYIVTRENSHQWWDPRTQVIHHVPGASLYAFSSVSAPFQFGTSIVHVWEHYSVSKGRWVEESRYAFSITGGRDGGFRGYSEKDDPAPGKWRVTIETIDGQAVGRLHFNVEIVDTPPLLTEEAK